MIFSDDWQNLHGLKGIFQTIVITAYVLFLLRIGMLMSFVGFALLPVITPMLKLVTAYICMMPLLAGFVKDWLFAIG